MFYVKLRHYAVYATVKVAQWYDDERIVTQQCRYEKLMLVLKPN